MRLTMKAFLPASLAELASEPEADQQIGAQAHAFPADEHHRKLLAHTSDEHEEHEEVEIGEEAVVTAGSSRM